MPGISAVTMAGPETAPAAVCKYGKESVNTGIRITEKDRPPGLTKPGIYA